MFLLPATLTFLIYVQAILFVPLPPPHYYRWIILRYSQ